MAVEQTLSIIKPDGVQKNLIGEIYSRFEKAGLEVVAAKMMHLSTEQAQGFYAVHKERPFFNDLVAYMTSGPVVVQALQGERRRSLKESRHHGCDEPGGCRSRHYSRRFCRKYRREHCARLRRRGNRRGRNRLFLWRRRRLPENALGFASCRARLKNESPGFAARRTRGAVCRARAKAVSRAPAYALDLSARRDRLRGDDGFVQVAAATPCTRRQRSMCQRYCRSTIHRMARSSGCSRVDRGRP